MLNITFWGGVGSVTGANFILENKNTKIAIDCGLHQGTPEAWKENSKDFPYDPQKIDFLFITHAHMDHLGRVPKLVKDGFKGVIFSTPETLELARLMFEDALKVMQINTKEMSGDVLLEPLYDDKDVAETFSLWQSISYQTKKQITPEFSVFVMDAGHILGSAMYEFIYCLENSFPTNHLLSTNFLNNRQVRVVFTGDSGNSPAPLLKDTDKIIGTDYLVVDSVYGDRNHESKEDRDAKFRQIVEETISSGGALIIPAFSLERTQVILYELNNLIEENKIPSVPVFLDSPLGMKVTEIYKKMTKDFNSEVQREIKGGDDIFNFPKLHITHNSLDSKNIINTPNPKIIIAGSGMSSGGRVLHHEINFLPDPKSTLLLVGYQAIGTLGRELKDKPKEVEINGEIVPIRARIEMISGYSSHKDMDNLVEMVSDTAETVKKVFVVMGEPSASAFLAQRLHEYLDVNATYPEKGKSYELK